MSHHDRLGSAQVSFDEDGAPAFLASKGEDRLHGLGGGSMDRVGCSGFRVESLQSV